ncbi:hypothetical protein [Citrobacter phage CVT22]|uniref:Uncharacterized protein n=1 Tax=Citrobacter phage CVT22 TaxID=1622234 RepID=A0A0R6BQ91_9CAUD|nr:hypothetical protein APL39_gp74 [Citrobacter phage CVT22]AJT60777.1 hypothetical protein [Citrobacter phage CVT22]
MSHKQAKRLRKDLNIVREDTQYTDKVMRTVMVDTGRIDDKGNAIMRPEVRTMRECKGERFLYQLLKRGRSHVLGGV